MSRHKGEYRVTLEGDLATAVRESASRQGVNAKESLERTIALYDFLQRQAMDGCNVLIVDPETDETTLLVLDDTHFSMWENELGN